MRELSCLRCRTDMEFIRREKIQLGQTGWLLGDLSNLLSGAMEVDIYSCPGCGKIEFFQMEDDTAPAEDTIAQVRCPRCGRLHDMDYPKCPSCGHNYHA